MNRRALISTFDKTGLDELGVALVGKGFDLVSTGGTSQYLVAQGLAVTEVSTITGFPEIMGGRVKTLHPHIFGGILARREESGDIQELDSRGLAPIDVVIVNLYPFESTVADPSVNLATALENIDIGGVALLRAAAKNFPHCVVLCSPSQYPEFIRRLVVGELDLDYRRSLAIAAFTHTSAYDRTINHWLRGGPEMDSETLAPIWKKAGTLRYGENPHQHAAIFHPFGVLPSGIPSARKLSGREVSYNNYLDLESAWRLCREFAKPAAVIVKHCNPCGVAMGASLADAFNSARLADPMSAYGGIIALNRPVDMPTAERILEKGTFFECIVAPGYSEEALLELRTRKKWCERLIILEMTNFMDEPAGFETRPIVGGLLVQDTDLSVWDNNELQIVSRKAPTREMLTEMRFAYTVAKYVRSNAIVISSDGMTLGIGAGQPNRVWSVERAIINAGGKLKGAILASDGFFPMPDAPEVALSAGITAIVQPGGSNGDEKVIELVDRYDAVMVFTGQRHFRH